MDKQEWLNIDHTQNLIAVINLGISEMNEFMTHKDRIGDNVDATAQQFCFCSGFVHAMNQVKEKVDSNESLAVTKEEEATQVKKDYPDEVKSNA